MSPLYSSARIRCQSFGLSIWSVNRWTIASLKSGQLSGAFPSFLALFLIWYQGRPVPFKNVPTVCMLILSVGSEGELMCRYSLDFYHQGRKFWKEPSKGSGALVGRRFPRSRGWAPAMRCGRRSARNFSAAEGAGESWWLDGGVSTPPRDETSSSWLGRRSASGGLGAVASSM